ncbi:MAG: DUF2835 domain-containing protein [Gammaproteobacteria bacterium]|jgi:hypothetical protein
MSEQVVCISLSITPHVLKRWYAGAAQIVEAISTDGRTVRFPANILRPFVTREGVNGVFEIRYDVNGKFQRITRL